MSQVRIPLVTNEFYHVFNRGVAKQPIFFSKSDYEQALLTLSYYSVKNPPMKLSRFKKLSREGRNDFLSALNTTDKLVEIISFVLMPNHFHFLLRQTAENGVSRFLSQFTNSYTRYVNTKHERVGPLFQGIFKAVHVEDDEQLVHLSRYIHLNPVTSYVISEKDLYTYKWSSLPIFISVEKSFIETEPILFHFSSKEDYRTFIIDQIGYARELKKIKHLSLEND